MIARSEKKLIRLLKLKKHRTKQGCFLIEGTKIVKEALLSNVELQQIFATDAWLQNHSEWIENKAIEVRSVPEEDIKAVSHLKSPPRVIALARLPQQNACPTGLKHTWVLGLEDIQDPANLGAILRVADWFGVQYVFCSPACADGYQPKVVQASKGSLFRIPLYYDDLNRLIKANPDLPVIASAADGKNLHKASKPSSGIVLLGNEGHGLSNPLQQQATQTLSIPASGQTESLNVAVAAGIFMDRLTEAK